MKLKTKEELAKKVSKHMLYKTFVFIFAIYTVSSYAQETHSSNWVYYGTQGKLQYKSTPAGDKIMDFSHAGYMGGGVAIPDVQVKITVNPSGGDDTENIQSAIDEVSGMELNGSFRGAVLLAPGDYQISESLVISTGGVVLRGSGSGYYGNIRSTIRLAGNPFNAITIRAPRRNNDGDLNNQFRTQITDSYIPSGTNTFRVSDASGFKTGDLISIDKPVTEKWIEFMQMDDLVRDGKPQTWIPAGSILSTERTVINISGNSITVDVPLSDSYDSRYLNPPGTVVRKLDASTRPVNHSGVENLHMVSPPQPYSHEQRHFTALRINGEDCWARNMLIEETMNSVAVGGKRITVERVTVQRKALHHGSSRPAEFAPNGGQVLIDRCNVIADNVWFIATGGKQSGPIVILNCNFIGDQRAESHQRWTTGMLYDNVRAENGGIDLRNRGSMGSGHGWSMGWGVAWNCVAKNYVIQNPPGVHNWMIGCIGESQMKPRPFDQEPNLQEGTVDSHNVPVYPLSLYLAQLKERLGEQALKNIGY